MTSEANAVGTAWLRAGYLQEPYGSQSRELLRDYTDQRIRALQPGQWLGLVTTLRSAASSSGSRWISTLPKEPTTSPKGNSSRDRNQGGRSWRPMGMLGLCHGAAGLRSGILSTRTVAPPVAEPSLSRHAIPWATLVPRLIPGTMEVCAGVPMKTVFASILLLSFGPGLQAQDKKPAPAAAPAPKAKPRVQLETSFGPIVLELEPDLAPATVANFLRYVKEGHYKGTTFHRVIPGFMIQGGGHLEDLSEKPGHEGIRNEAEATFKGGLRNVRGTVAMARTGDPHSATAQFFINTVDNAFLDFRAANPEGWGYCTFGRVVSGMETVDKIEKVRTTWKRGMQNVPEYAVKITGAAVLPAK